MKRVLIHSKGQSSFDSLTAINKNRVSSAFARLYVHGLEASPLSQIRWVNEDQFELLVPRVPNDIDLIQGTRIQASVESDVIKIHNILNVTRSSSLMKKAYTREFTNHVDGFELIDESWFDKVIADPFVKKAFDESKNGMSKTPCNRFMTLLSNFYKEARTFTESTCEEPEGPNAQADIIISYGNNFPADEVHWMVEDLAAEGISAIALNDLDDENCAALIFDGEERYRFTEDLLYSSTMIVAAQRLVENKPISSNISSDCPSP